MAAANRLHGLDALRGIAALCVVGLHARAIFPYFPDVLGKGYLGVDFFLMLSGYLMARITEPRLAASLDPGAFLKARYRRFWPTVAFGSVIGIPYLWVRTQGDPLWFASALAANMALLPFPADHLLFPLNVPVWTIFAELAANAVHVLLLRRVGTGPLIALALALFAATLWSAMTYGSLDSGARPSNAIYGLPRVFFAYVLGILLWRRRDVAERLPAPGWLALVAMPGAMLLAWAMGWRGWPFDLVFVVVLCPLVIAGALRIARDTAPGRFSAELSFPLFAVHVPVLEAVRMAGYGVLTGVPLAFAAALACLWWTNWRTRIRRVQTT
ncbi:MAG TPA: acyltransferase [Novosphingobium sp.]|nr:acyltransferase [Novosphingobium sp.]